MSNILWFSSHCSSRDRAFLILKAYWEIMVNCIILPKFIPNWYILTQLCSHWQSLFYLCQLSIERLWYMQTAIGVDRCTLRTNGLSNLCIETHSYKVVCNKWYNWSIKHQHINSWLSQFVLSLKYLLLWNCSGIGSHC